jgi:hypothetical protein
MKVVVAALERDRSLYRQMLPGQQPPAPAPEPTPKPEPQSADDTSPLKHLLPAR